MSRGLKRGHDEMILPHVDGVLAAGGKRSQAVLEIRN